MRRLSISCCCATALAIAQPAQAHDGPPFPIVTDRTTGAYVVSVWTDPDTTDDGTSGGQFWVMIQPRGGGGAIGSDTQVTVSATPDANAGRERWAQASPVRGDASTRFAGLVLDREGVFRVQVTIEGPRGPARIESQVTATYNLRPPPVMIAIYLVPFVLAGSLWATLLVRRRRVTSAESGRPRSTHVPQP